MAKTNNVERFRNLGDEELDAQQRQAAEQLFRLRFQIRSGQQEGIKKLRELRKDIARMQTIARDREVHGTQVGAAGGARRVPRAAASTAPVPAPAKKRAQKAEKAAS